MGDVIPLPKDERATKTFTFVEVHPYRQDDGRTMFAVQIVFRDGTWKILAHAWVPEEAEEKARAAAAERGVPFLQKGSRSNQCA